MLKKILYSIHRMLGTILSTLFVVWFLSGFVMIYHTFPKVSNKDKYNYADVLQNKQLPIDSFLSCISDKNSITSLKLTSFGQRSYLEVTRSDNVYRISTDSTPESIKQPTYLQIEEYAKRWNEAEIAHVDTLRELEQWIPFSRLQKDFPIYKFYFADDDKHQLYISSVTGEALQFTNKNNRFWAWVGAIPHWVYFTSLRQDSQLWMNVVICLSGIGCIMCITGIILGIRSYIIQYRKKKKLKTPYKKFAYKWHHILGFVFGIFVFTFVFSGMMSLATVPQWMVKIHNPAISKNLRTSEPIILKNYKLDYQKIIDQYPNELKNIEWSSFGDVPLYKVIIANKMHVFNASVEDILPLDINEQMITDKLSKQHNEPIHITQIQEYDNYYNGKTNHLPLPVFKVNIDDADNSTYYINPKNGNIHYFNTNTKVRRWTYQTLHSFKIGFLVKHPILWNIIMWTTMIGGTLISLTGFWLGFKYLKRKINRLKKYICTSHKNNKGTC